MSYLIFNTSYTPTAVFWQSAPIMWVHLPSSPQKIIYPYSNSVADLIQLGRETSKKYFGKDPEIIIQPYTKVQLDWLFQTTDEWPIACAIFSGKLDNYYHPDKLIQFCN